MYREATVKKIEEIQYLLATGKTRPEVAKELGYNDVTALYKFASRNKLEWNEKKKNYDAVGNDGTPIEAVKEINDYPTGKVANIISMFERGIDGREIAKKLRFNSYQAMAEYMKEEGYIWNNDKRNYFKQPLKIGGMNNDIDDKMINEPEAEAAKSTFDKNVKSDVFFTNEYKELLDILVIHKDRLIEFINSNVGRDIIPKYLLSGTVRNKTMSMVDSLESLIKDFCSNNNLSQREFFEIASIEALKRYGYKNEVKAYLKI